MQPIERIVRVQILADAWDEAKATILAGDYGMVDIDDAAHAVTMKASAALKLRAMLPQGAVLAIGTEKTPESDDDPVGTYLALNRST